MGHLLSAAVLRPLRVPLLEEHEIQAGQPTVWKE